MARRWRPSSRSTELESCRRGGPWASAPSTWPSSTTLQTTRRSSTSSWPTTHSRFSRSMSGMSTTERIASTSPSSTRTCNLCNVFLDFLTLINFYYMYDLVLFFVFDFYFFLFYPFLDHFLISSISYFLFLCCCLFFREQLEDFLCMGNHALMEKHPWALQCRLASRRLLSCWWSTGPAWRRWTRWGTTCSTWLWSTRSPTCISGWWTASSRRSRCRRSPGSAR